MDDPDNAAPTPSDNSRLVYIVSSQAWYRDSLPLSRRIGEVIVQRQALADGRPDGCMWEFVIDWCNLGDGGDLAPHAELFDEAWVAFAEQPHLFTGLAALAEGGWRPSITDVTLLLDGLGYVDVTARTRED